MVELIESLKSESSGTRRNAAVLQYLQALPKGISEQSYKALNAQGNIIAETTLGSMSLATAPKGFPDFLEISGVVIGAGFPPGSITVKFKYSLVEEEADEDGEPQEHTITCSASEDQVETALRLRNHRVIADVVQIDNSNRLLQLRAVEEFLPKPKPFSKEVIREHFERWDEVMKGLA